MGHSQSIEEILGRRLLLGEVIARNSRLLPDREAVVYGRKRFTYRQFNARINQLAHALLSLNIKKGTKVAILLYNCNEFLEAYFALAKIGASVKYARERMQFGKPIGSFQMIQEMIVDMVAETEAGRLLAYRALDTLDAKQKSRWQSSLAKAYATEAAVRTTSKAIQIHGAMGLSSEYPVERYFRDARTLTMPDGTTQMQKLIVGRDILGIRAMTGL